MRFNGNGKILALEASSPKELSVNLSAAIKEQRVKPCAVAVSISDPKVMVCSFHLESAALKDLEHHLVSEAVEIMSLTPDEIVLDFQVTKSDERSVQGIYICAPKGLLEDYLKVLSRKFFNPVKVTERFLVGVDALYQQGKLNEGRICFLDFSEKGTLSLFISSKGECDLLRKIKYEDNNEAKKEIIQSLRSASAKSRVKYYDHIYYQGAFEGMEHMAAYLKDVFHAQSQELPAIDQKAMLADGREYFSMNLIKQYNFSPRQLKYIHATANIVIALCIMNLALMGMAMVKKGMEISRVKEYYQDTEYQYALQLRDGLKE